MDSYRFYLGARVYYAICWTTTVTVNLVFMVQVAGLDPLQMVLVGTALELSVFLFEIPTGVVAELVAIQSGRYGPIVTMPWAIDDPGRVPQYAPTPHRAPVANVDGHWGSVDAPAAHAHTRVP